jgi:transcriptional regulatory protein LevR/transcriptional regulator with AAA-type ATPase domain
MKRIDRIYNYIRERSQKYTIEQLTGQIGFDASEISESLDILRNNVSMELNVLFKMDKVIKITSRPVLYFDKEVLENLCAKKLGKGPIEVGKLEEIITIKEDDSLEKSPFKYLIGANGSLKNQVEQAKAAILYPPNGLHTLIVGQTGVGKTLFVNMMYSYGKYEKKLKEDAPFKIFNCADYYNNSQLLVSHIFGHVKGSFTGADVDKQGLVEKADGGILFLDEIHRLPPEGQEMIFYFMDTGTFNRLGETDRKRKANVLIIGATTEEPLSLMKTFIRRIPIVITLPPLNERPLQESVDLIKFLLSNEAHRVNKSIKITADAAKALIGSISFGNVGQLKSNIQLVCAKSFLNGIHNKDYIEINFKSLPDHIKNDLLSLGVKRTQMEELAKYLDEPIVITPQGHKVLVEDDPYEPPFNLYKIIEDKAALLREEGMSEGLIKKFITVDINLHIKSFYNKFNNHMSSREKMLKIVDKNLLELAEEIQELARKRLKKEYKDQFLYALSLHLSALFKRLKSNQSLQYTNIESVIKEYPNEFEVALEIKTKVEERYNIEIPKEELAYFTLLLSSIQEEKQGGQVAIIVVTHGNSTATSMVDVTQKLFGYNNLIAVDMPLEVSPKDILDKILEKIQDIDKENGILLLVDMGSLTSFGTMIMEKVNTKVKTLDMVSTSLVLEASRKANIFGMDLESIYNSLKKFKGYGGVIDKTHPYHSDKGVIITICTTGEGAAVKLKELVEDSIRNITDEYIDVIPIGIQDVKERVKEIREQHKILASIGITNPHIDAPFIPLDALIDGRGEKVLKNIFRNDDFTMVDKGHNLVVRNLCEDSLKQILTYLNPLKIISVLMEFQRVLGKELKREFSNSMQIKLIIHCGCAVERMVIKEGLSYKGERNNIDGTLIRHIKKAAEVFHDTIQIELTEDEILYIADMLSANSIV